MLKRIWGYIMEMYPPVPSFIASFFSFFSIYFTLELLAGNENLTVTIPALTGAFTIFLFLLFLRISDEFKDYEVDKYLFPDRALPSGRVLVQDLKILMFASVFLMFLINIIFGNALPAFLVLFGFGLLMLKYFFVPQYISKSLLLALLTHNPSVLFMNFYVTSVFAAQYNVPVFSKNHIFVAILFWFPGLVWELSRKIKAPQDENEYNTYSKIFGYKLAAMIPVVIIFIHALMMLTLGSSLGFSMIFNVIIVLSFIGFTAMFLRFLFKPEARTAKLKPVAEAYLLITSVTLVVQLVWGRSILWLLT